MRMSSSILYAQCPCGSGKKFKFCHYDAVRNYLPDDPTPSDVTEEVRRTMQPSGMVNGVDPVNDFESIQAMKEAIELQKYGDYAAAMDKFRRAPGKRRQGS